MDDEEFRRRLREELAELPGPGLGDLVGDSVRMGRRLRNRRRVRRAAGLLSVGLAVGVLGLSGEARRWIDQGAGSGPVVVVQAVGSTVDPGRSIGPGRSSGPDPLVPATDDMLLTLLGRLLPPGRVSDAGAVPGDLHIRLFLEGDHGAGMIGLRVSGGKAGRSAAAGDGELRVLSDPGDCTKTRSIEWARPDGVVIGLDLGTCRRAAGPRGAAGPLALTDEQAERIVRDPRWGPWMPVSLGHPAAAGVPTS